MAIILTNKGFEILIDDSDYDLLKDYKWSYTDGYAKTKIKGKTIRMHRLILNVSDPNIFVDHKNHLRHDNRRENIRIATRSENGKNRKSSGKSKYLGVSINTPKQIYKKKNGELTKWIGEPKYMATIFINGKNKTIGRYKKEIDAALAYNEYAKKIHGEFANLNVIE